MFSGVVCDFDALTISKALRARVVYYAFRRLFSASRRGTGPESSSNKREKLFSLISDATSLQKLKQLLH